MSWYEVACAMIPNGDGNGTEALDGRTSSKVTRQEEILIYFQVISYIGYRWLQGNQIIGLHNLSWYDAAWD